MKINRIKRNYIMLILLLMCLFLCSRPPPKKKTERAQTKTPGGGGRLQRIKDEGIGIILTTGNHDFDIMDAKEFEEAYFSLLSPVDRDPASLSYTSIVKDVVFFAMDDNAVYPGGQGQYSAETMQWLEEMLTKYQDSRIIFLSHHNVLYGRDGENPFLPTGSRPPNCLPFANEHGVRLAMTGHMHFQYILE